MTFFTELSEYSNMIEPFHMNGVVNVGWIDIRANFQRGETQKTLSEKLLAIACGSESAHTLVEPIRESPRCAICGPISLQCGLKVLPEAELWVPGEGVVFASPIAIIHYIEAHEYRPPAEYIEAVNTFALNSNFIAEDLYRAKLVECGWFDHNFEKS